MKKLISALFLVTLISCKGGSNGATTPGTDTGSGTVVTNPCDTKTEDPAPTTDDVKTVTDVSISEVAATDEKPCLIPTPVPEGTQLKANYILEGFDDAEKAKMENAIRKALIVLNSEEFKQRILDFTFDGKQEFVDNAGLTNQQVYDAIMNGKEDLLPEVDHEMDLHIHLYYSSKSTVGYTTPDQIDTYTNSKFFSYYTEGGVAGNVVHEWTHKLGFEHDFYNTYGRSSSVPYAVGYIVEEMVDALGE